MRFVDLWRWDGKVRRETYALVGVVAFAIKSVVDRLIGLQLLAYPHGFLTSYWAPLGTAARLGHLSESELRYLLTMLVWAMPFIWIGVTMSVKRLRDAGQPLWLAILFFIPFINLLFFIALCFLPSRQRTDREVTVPWPAVRSLDGIMGNYWGTRQGAAMLSVVLLVLPSVFGVEHAAAVKPPTFVVRTAIDVHARREQVWQQVIAFAEIPLPAEMLFRAGIAYPIRAEITGHGAGALRRCIFSTGPFLEPIEVWDEPYLLKFGVNASPAPLNEMTPYGHIEPRHLHGYFVSEEGQFLLTALPDGGTRLEGTTRYRNAMWPAAYWHMWSNYIIHRIHLRVLTHIKEAAENSGRGND